jgi:hypothetical protein
MSGLAKERNPINTELASPAEGRRSEPTLRERTLSELFRGIGTDFSTLLHLETRLARVETREKVERILRSLSWLVGGSFLIYSAALALMMSAAAGYGLFLPFWLAVLLIALFTLVLGAMLIQVGRKRLKQSSLYPRQTVRSLRRDLALFQSRFRMSPQPSLATLPAGVQRNQRLLLAAGRESGKKETSMWQMLKETVNG